MNEVIGLRSKPTVVRNVLNGILDELIEQRASWVPGKDRPEGITPVAKRHLGNTRSMIMAKVMIGRSGVAEFSGPRVVHIKDVRFTTYGAEVLMGKFREYEDDVKLRQLLPVDDEYGVGGRELVDAMRSRIEELSATVESQQAEITRLLDDNPAEL
jgi:hypothetical protein